MFKGIKNGWHLIVDSFKVFGRYPKLLVPLIASWLIYAPAILYLQYFFEWDVYSLSQILFIVLGIIFFFAFLLAISNLVLLELIQQIESNRNLNVLSAWQDVVLNNLLKVLPVVLAWSLVWFLLTIIQVIFSRKRGNSSENSQLTAENAARTLAGYQSFSISRAFFEALKKGVRMVIFLILPAIAWENLSFIASVKKGFTIFKTHLSEFSTGFVLTEVASTIIFLPIAILFTVSGEMEVSLPSYIWYVAIVYIAFAWSYSMYLEQMFTAELYLWHMKWEPLAQKALRDNGPVPTLSDIPRPTLLDGVPDLVSRHTIASS